MSVAGGGGATNPFYSAPSLSLSLLRFLGFGQEQIGEQFVRLSGGKTAPLLSSSSPVACWPLKWEGERVICKNPFLSSVLLYLSLSFAPFFIVGHILQLQPLLSQGLSRVGWDLFQAFLVVAL